MCVCVCVCVSLSLSLTHSFTHSLLFLISLSLYLSLSLSFSFSFSLGIWQICARVDVRRSPAVSSISGPDSGNKSEASDAFAAVPKYYLQAWQTLGLWPTELHGLPATRTCLGLTTQGKTPPRSTGLGCNPDLEAPSSHQLPHAAAELRTCKTCQLPTTLMPLASMTSVPWFGLRSPGTNNKR